MRTTFLMFALFLCVESYAQSTYEITVVGQHYSTELIQNAIESADFCGYHYSDERHLLKFDDGTRVELKSGEEMELEGSPLPVSCITSDKKDTHPIWGIANDGTILRGSNSIEKSLQVK